MLESSFLHLPGIGPETEERLWSLGCRSWDDLEGSLEEHFSRQRVERLQAALEESRAAHDACELDYFRERLKSGEMWRLVPTLLANGLGGEIAYLDIETTGLGGPPASHSTSIAVLFRGELFVEHDTQAKRELLELIDREAKLYVTFNGLTFDMPFLRAEFDLEFSQPHLDLRYWFKRLGYRGGLKAIQKAFPEVPQRVSLDIDGFDAVRLWNMHDWGVEGALETLKVYNAEDTIVLEQLLFTGLNLEAEGRPHLRLPTHALPLPPPITGEINLEVYRMLRA